MTITKFVHVDNLARPRSYSTRCVMQGTKMTKRQVEIQSEVNMGLHSEASALLQKDVLGHLSDDPVGVLIITLLIGLGNSVIKHVPKPLKRGKYISWKLRLCARVLQELAYKDRNAGRSWSDFIAPSSYHIVVDAVLKVNGGVEVMMLSTNQRMHCNLAIAWKMWLTSRLHVPLWLRRKKRPEIARFSRNW